MKAAAITAIAAPATIAPAADVIPAKAGAHAAQIWTWLGDIPDPEIPVISIVDLGIVRDVRVAADGACEVTITPTYSGCPAMQVIADAITEALHAHGVKQVRLHNQISPAWTTDWMSDAGKAALKGYGIAPPAQQVIDISGLRAPAGAAARRGAARAENAAGAPGGAATATATVAAAAAAISRRVRPVLTVACPRCGSRHTEITSQFGSTPCKALYKCLDCREPFDYFKCH
ncbi:MULTISPECIES: 1,2-phenylacetyl-CoA epoxidase subunit PaaD [unclassified Duganella]|uniref:1,2-phenylacetyl-CoA epoxidase subunit PaaD n=1 Tax=unclassified Duganella TaxID=2636909 RepID=UPI0008867805|nr:MULTISPECIES: 1,2-phenylacetyl-CoA epoxidase subunit PaaD [unclassified Duganella]SDG25236.1 ring-1,2-phenylacetyl-CoA epoxidase subunit PaaD [Duganella sp. OV458]SDJ22932.1 ring-1,2-phenylacetyl-CoA epoxidase subunit PaaD [Duganella sp. OV510]